MYLKYLNSVQKFGENDLEDLRNFSKAKRILRVVRIGSRAQHG